VVGTDEELPIRYGDGGLAISAAHVRAVEHLERVAAEATTTSPFIEMQSILPPVGENVVGRPGSSAEALKCGPRHCGQLPAAAGEGSSERAIRGGSPGDG